MGFVLIEGYRNCTYAELRYITSYLMRHTVSNHSQGHQFRRNAIICQVGKTEPITRNRFAVVVGHLLTRVQHTVRTIGKSYDPCATLMVAVWLD